MWWQKVTKCSIVACGVLLPRAHHFSKPWTYQEQQRLKWLSLTHYEKSTFSDEYEPSGQNIYTSEDSKENTTTWATQCQDCKGSQIWPYLQDNIILPQFHDVSRRHIPGSDTTSHSNSSICLGTCSSSPSFHSMIQRGPGEAYISSMLHYRRETLSLGNPNLLQQAISLPALCSWGRHHFYYIGQ